MFKLKPIFVVQINYKSGNSFTGKFESFKFTKTGASTTVEWKVWGDTQVLYLNVDEIESVFAVKTFYSLKFWK